MQRFLALPLQHIVFGLFALTLVTSPVLLAANRPVFWLSYACIIGIATVLWYLNFQRQGAAKSGYIALKYYWPAALGYGLVLLWCVVQMSSFSMTSLVHPMWTVAGNALGADVESSISIDRFESMDGFIRLATYGMVFFLALQIGRRTEDAERILKLVFYTCLACVAYGLYMYSMNIEKVLWLKKTAPEVSGYWGSLSGTFINRNSFATYIGIGVLLSTIYFYKKLFQHTSGLYGKRLSQMVMQNFFAGAYGYLLVITTLFTALTLTHSRAGMVCVVIAFLILAAILVIRRSDQGKRWQIVIPSVVVALMASVLVLYGGDALFKRFNAVEKNVEARTDIYRVTSVAIAQNKWLGTGINTFEPTFSLYRDGKFGFDVSRRVDHAHNTYLETVLELGFPVFFCFLAVYLWIIWRLLKAIVQRKRHTHFALLALMSALLFGMHAVVDFSLEMPALAIVFATLLGVGVAQSWSSREGLYQGWPISVAQRKTMLVAVLAVVVVVTLASAAQLRSAAIQQSHADILALINKAKLIETEMLVKALAEYQSLMPSDDSRVYKDAALLSMALAGAEGEFSHEGQALYSQAKTYLVHGLALSPVDATSWSRLAYVEMLLHGPNKQVADAFYLSALTGPYQSTVFYNYLPRLPLIWGVASDEAKALFLNELYYVWHLKYSHRPDRHKRRILKVLSSALGVSIVKEALADDPAALEEVEMVIEKYTL